MKNLIRQLRAVAGVTQQQLAEKARTSQSAIAAYESGSKSPTLRTLERFSSSVGLEFVAGYAPRMTREDHRSLAFHEAIAEVLRADPIETVKRAKGNLDRLIEQHPGANSLLAMWQVWLNLPTRDLIDMLLSHSLTARDMRQVSPFSGLLSAAERAQVLRRFREDQEG